MPSFEQSKSSKLWSVRFRVIAEGREAQKRLSGYRTKKEANQAYLEFMASYKPEKLADGGLTFDALVEAYLIYSKGRTKESTFYESEGKIRNHLLPYFSGRKVASIKPLDILQWQQTVSSYSYKYQSNLRGYLSSLLRYADRYYDIPSIMSRVDPLRNTEPKKEMQFWTEAEFKKFIGAIPPKDQMHRLYFLTLYLLGCRKGEALALTWNDIDLSHGLVSITKNITRKTKDAPYLVTTPKNRASNRKVSMPKSLCAEFEKYRESLGDAATDDSFVFGGDRPLADRTTDRIFGNACKDAGVKKIRLHDLRHSCASLLISHGVSIVAVSKRLGHTNIEQTLNTYSHMMPRDDEMMLQIFDEVLGTVGTQ